VDLNETKIQTNILKLREKHAFENYIIIISKLRPPGHLDKISQKNIAYRKILL
jgi:hypothetical protein